MCPWFRQVFRKVSHKEQGNVITGYNVKSRLQFSIPRRLRERVQRVKLWFWVKNAGFQLLFGKFLEHEIFTWIHTLV